MYKSIITYLDKILTNINSLEYSKTALSGKLSKNKTVLDKLKLHLNVCLF